MGVYKIKNLKVSEYTDKLFVTEYDKEGYILRRYWIEREDLIECEGKESEVIQIPSPHGRLIDGDKLRATLRRWTEDEWNQKASPVSWAYAYEDLIDLIDDAPTILEAE